MPQPNTFLSVRGLSHTYHTKNGETPALKDIHFDLFTGEFAAIIGPSGCEKLTSNGWQLVRISGSHHQYKKAGVSTLATIPNHGKKDIPIGILKSLEKQTGLSLRR